MAVRGEGPADPNATGFLAFDYSISAKWLELLKEVAPGVTRVAVLRDPTLPSGTGPLGAIQGAAPSFAWRWSAALLHLPAARNAGLIVPGTPLAAPHRELIAAPAARHRLPTVYSLRFYVTAGGLISYGPDIIDPHRRAAHPQRRETGRSAGTGSDQVPAGGQP